MDNGSNGSDSNYGIIIGIVTFLIIIIFLIVVIIGFNISNRNNNNNRLQTQTGEFLSDCTTTPCSNNLICDGNTFVCKRQTGEICTDFTDCLTGLICSGVCSTGPTGSLNQLCPCNNGFLCVTQSNNQRICKAIGGNTCQNNSDCVSGLCQNNICSSGSPNAFPCTNNIQCGSQNCSNGFCQNPGVISGSLGSSCAGNCVGYTGAVCIGTAAQPLTCSCVSGTGQAGNCVMATQGILSTCSNRSICANDLICYDTIGEICTTNETGCFCDFPYPLVNGVAPGSNCINGMRLGENNQCFNVNGLGCDSGGQCFSQICNGPAVLAVYRFANPNIAPSLRTNFIGATQTEILRALSGPTGIIEPHKMFGRSNGNVDTIYLIDNNQGLFFCEYNPINNTIVTSWTLLIPHVLQLTIGTNINTRTLIDVGYNGNTFIFAFNEVISTGTGTIIAENDTVYIAPRPNILDLQPFNYQPGSGITGTQYTTNNIPLLINYIDISPANPISTGNDVLISINGTIYVKASNASLYSISTIQGGPMNGNQTTGLTGPARFYYDNIQNEGGTGAPVCPGNGINPIRCPSVFNTSFIGPFNAYGSGTYEQVVQFSGNIASSFDFADKFNEGIQYRAFDYSIYSVAPDGIRQGSLIVLSNAYRNNIFLETVVSVNYRGSSSTVPYRVSQTSRCVATNNAFYIITPASCS